MLRNITYSLLLAFGVVFTMLILAALPPLCRAPPAGADAGGASSAAAASGDSKGSGEGAREAEGEDNAPVAMEGDARAPLPVRALDYRYIPCESCSPFDLLP